MYLGPFSYKTDALENTAIDSLHGNQEYLLYSESTKAELYLIDGCQNE